MTDRRDAVDELTCRELVEIITDYLEGALRPADRARFDEHLFDCPGCVAYLDQMRQTISALGRLSEDTIPAAAAAELLSRFRRWKVSPRPA